MRANFEEFVVARGRALLRFAYVLTGDGYFAEDLVQEALLRTHRRWSAVEHADGPEPYVRRTVLHEQVLQRILVEHADGAPTSGQLLDRLRVRHRRRQRRQFAAVAGGLT